MMWLNHVLKEARQKKIYHLKLYSDNKAEISSAHNLVQHNRTKHVEIDRHFIKKKLKTSIICMSFVPTTQQLVDILTKGLQR